MIKVKALRPIDWFQVILEIQRHGYTLQNISAAVDIPRTTLIGWRDLDVDPGHSEAERVISLWAQVTATDIKRIPRHLGPGEFPKPIINPNQFDLF